MTTALKNMLTKLESLPAEEQNAIANLLKEELAWHKSYEKSQKKLSSLVAEPLAEYGLKSDLHTLIDKINDNKMLNAVHLIVSRFTASKGATVVLSAPEKKAIDEALKSVKEGRTNSHEKVMARMKKKYPSLVK